MNILKIDEVKHFVVISDVHLRDPNDELTKLFISTLNSFQNKETVFLLGDIFDFIGVFGPYFFNLWIHVFQACKALKARGSRIYFVEGNHDFGFEHFKSPFLNECFSDYGDFIIEYTHPQLGLVHLRHGDDVVCSPDYLKFRNLVKSKFFQLFTGFLFPGWLMQFIFSRYAKFSRKKDVYRKLPEDFLLFCIQKVIEKYPSIHVLIIGHVHIVRDILINNKVRFLVGSDWLSQPNVLVCNEKGQLNRINII